MLYKAFASLIGPMCLGRDASAINALLIDDLQRNLHGVGRTGPAMYALSAIDIALWDIAGKAANLPLYRLLGAVTYAQPSITKVGGVTEMRQVRWRVFRATATTRELDENVDSAHQRAEGG